MFAFFDSNHSLLKILSILISQKQMPSAQDSVCEHNVHLIADYLKQGTPFEEVLSTISSVVQESLPLDNQIKKVKKEKNIVSLRNQTSVEQLDTIERLSTGRVKYGPITVNPRKKPSKTIFTGRRSKNEILYGEEEEKRRTRRERNRIAATKCREKRENVLAALEQEIRDKEIHYEELTRHVEQLHQRKQHLESLLQQPTIHYAEPVQVSSETVQPYTSAPMPPSQEFEYSTENQNEFPSLLINSTNSNDLINLRFDSQSHEPITIASSSLNRLLDECVPLIDANNNNNLKLYNSAYDLPTCAQQYSSSSSNEDDSMASIQRNSLIY